MLIEAAALPLEGLLSTARAPPCLEAQVVNETRDVAAATLVALDRQGQQLERAAHGVEQARVAGCGAFCAGKRCRGMLCFVLAAWLLPACVEGPICLLNPPDPPITADGRKRAACGAHPRLHVSMLPPLSPTPSDRRECAARRAHPGVHVPPLLLPQLVERPRPGAGGAARRGNQQVGWGNGLLLCCSRDDIEREARHSEEIGR